LAKRRSAGPEIVFPSEKDFLAGQNYRSTRNPEIQTYRMHKRKPVLPDTTQIKPEICVGVPLHLCYFFRVKRGFQSSPFQFHISPYKFFRLLNYTASYF